MPEKNQISPIDPDQWPAELDGMKDSFASRLNVYRTMAHNPDLLRNWSALRGHVVIDTALGQERLEVAILRVAARLRSHYEWSHHVDRAQALGMDMARIRTIAGPFEGMGDDDALIAKSVDQLLDHTKLDAQTLAALTEAVGIKAVFDLMATVGFYKTLGCIIETFGVSLEDHIPAAPLD